MTLEELDRWLDVYGRAWERQDIDGFVACFAEDAVYHWGPWGEPLRGHAEIRLRTEQAIARAGGHPLRPRAARDHARRPRHRALVGLGARPPPRDIEEDEGIFLVTLADDGRCTEFRDGGTAARADRRIGSGMAYDEALADRIRDVLADRGDRVREQKMFGGITFMVDGHMTVGVVKDELMARVGADGEDDALAQPHARTMDFTGRPMTVHPCSAGVADEDDVRAWVDRALAFTTTLPPK